MMGRYSKVSAIAATLALAVASITIFSAESAMPTLRRQLSSLQQYALPESAKRWCEEPELPPLNYLNCDPNDIVYEIPYGAGMTNGLKMMLLAVIEAFEQNRCFYITEAHNHMLWRDDPTQALNTFIRRYFETIGLLPDHPIIKKARREGRVETLNGIDEWMTMEHRRIHGVLHNITSLGYENMESTFLKKVMLMRMWRFLPKVRHDSCSSLEQHGLKDDYLAFSVRRGDKDTEGFAFTNPQDYIAAAEKTRDQHFGGFMPSIFVATDDCAVMQEFRQLRPEWTFVSECDQSVGHNGFVLTEMRQWTLEQTDEHYRKFFVELIGLASAKFYIGVAYTNVAWWVSYMRPHRWSHQFLDKPNSAPEHTLNVW